MKNTLLLIFLFVSCFLASCQATAQNNSKFNKVIQNQAIISQSNSSTNNDTLASKIGNVQSGKQSVCLKIQNPNLKVGDSVQIVLTDKPQKVLNAQIAEKSACEETGFGTLDAENITDYQLKSTENDFVKRGFGIGVVNLAEEIKVNNGLATVDLDGDKKNEYFRGCTSNEGLHLTVWSGKPLIGKRIWHSYYGVGYDTESNCKEKDY